MKDNIRHIWFDLDGTLTIHTPEFRHDHNELRYNTYAAAVEKPRDEGLDKEFDALYKVHGSNSAVFRSLGLPSDYWQHHFNSLDETKYFSPDPRVYETLDQLRAVVPISIFTNVKPERNARTLKAIGVDSGWFTHILTGDDIKERKPALDGFHLMVERSSLPANEILYVGDRVDVDVKPAKAVGMLACLVWGKSEDADYSFDDFRGLLTLLVP